jgi:uncharacterized protein (TIGR03067 family)
MKYALFSILAAALFTAADASKEDLEKMQGEWAAVSMTRDGQKFSDDEAQAFFRTVKGDEYTVHHFRRVLGKGRFTIDASKKPKTIDVTTNGLKVLGIYELDGNTYRVCTGLPGKERPTDFTSPEGSGRTLATWERDKRQPANR